MKDLEIALGKPVGDLKQRYYVLHNREDPTQNVIVPYLDIDSYDKVLSRKYYIVVHYGTIVRGIGTSFSLTTRWAHRSMGENSWWHQNDCPRRLMDPEGYEVTECVGYEEQENAEDVDKSQVSINSEEANDLNNYIADQQLPFLTEGQDEYAGFDEFFL